MDLQKCLNLWHLFGAMHMIMNGFFWSSVYFFWVIHNAIMVRRRIEIECIKFNVIFVWSSENHFYNIVITLCFKNFVFLYTFFSDDRSLKNQIIPHNIVLFLSYEISAEILWSIYYTLVFKLHIIMRNDMYFV